MTTPQTAAGLQARAALHELFATNIGDDISIDEACDAIEAEARAAALDEARAAVPTMPADDLAGGTFEWGYRAGWNAAGEAIDALRAITAIEAEARAAALDAPEVVALADAARRIRDDHRAGYEPSIGAIGQLFRALAAIDALRRDEG